MNWLQKAKEIVAKIERFQKDEDGWKAAKQTKDVNVWYKSSPDWNGLLYKSEAIIAASPETVYSYIEPLPESPRSQWDKAIKELQTLEKVEKDVAVIRTITHSAFGGLISSRDFVDLSVTTRTDDFISTCSEAVEHSSCPPANDKVRGFNHPCAIICHRIKGEAMKTRLVSYIQTDLGGMLPKSLVDSALPSNMVNFVTTLKQALKSGGHLHDV